MIKGFIFLIMLSLYSFAYEYRAYDIGGSELRSKSEIMIKGEVYTLLPFSDIRLKKEEVNLDGDFTLLFGKVNGISIKPIKLASNYKLQNIVIKVFKSNSIFDETTFITESQVFFLDNDFLDFSLTIHKDY